MNRLWAVDLEDIPRVQGRLDFAKFDRGSTSAVDLPLTKLVDTFEVRRTRVFGAWCSLPSLAFASPLQRFNPARTPAPAVQASYEYVGSTGTVWTLQTNKDAPRYRLVRTDIAADSPAFADVVAQDPEALLQWASLLGGSKLVLSYLRNVQVGGRRTVAVLWCLSCCVGGGVGGGWGWGQEKGVGSRGGPQARSGSALLPAGIGRTGAGTLGWAVGPAVLTREP